MNSVAVDGSYETENVDNGKVKTEKTPAQQEPARVSLGTRLGGMQVSEN